MNTSQLFKNAVLNLYKQKIYTVDFAIIKTEELSERNRITAEDYEDLLIYLSEEQEKNMQIETVQETTQTEDVET